MANIGAWIVIGRTVTLTINGQPIQGVVENWTPAGVTVLGVLYTWSQITQWVLS